MADDRPDDILQTQIDYYRARAGEYDEWFLRQSRYDRGPEHRARWFGEIAAIERVLLDESLGRDVLELACGTGLWTRHLSAANRRVVALDASAEMMAINRSRVASDRVRYVMADIFKPCLSGRFDTVFFAFWLSHVPLARFDEFWDTVRQRLRSGGRAFFVDSLLEQDSTARDHDRLSTSGVVPRKLNDGRRFDIVKVFYEPADLEQRLRVRGWTGWVRATERFFLYGALEP